MKKLSSSRPHQDTPHIQIMTEKVSQPSDLWWNQGRFWFHAWQWWFCQWLPSAKSHPFGPWACWVPSLSSWASLWSLVWNWMGWLWATRMSWFGWTGRKSLSVWDRTIPILWLLWFLWVFFQNCQGFKAKKSASSTQDQSQEWSKWMVYYVFIQPILFRMPFSLALFGPKAPPISRYLQACFMFEGIGLILPTFDASKKPEDFPRIYTLTMTATLSLVCCIGVFGYMAFGQEVHNLILLDFQPGAWLGLSKSFCWMYNVDSYL